MGRRITSLMTFSLMIRALIWEMGESQFESHLHLKGRKDLILVSSQVSALTIGLRNSLS